MSWAEGCPESFPQLRNLALRSCFLCHLLKCLPAAALTWPASCLVGVLQVVWFVLTFLWVSYFCFYLSLPSLSLLLVSFCFLPFSHMCLGYAGDSQNQRCF